MDGKKLAAYSFLAHVNENNVGIRDLLDVFVPLLERALSVLVKRGTSRGQSSVLKEIFEEQYGLDVPLPLIKKMLEKIAKRYNSKCKNDIVVHKDGAFLINECAFAEYSAHIEEVEKDHDELKIAYENFLKEVGCENGDFNDLLATLENSRIELAQIFSNGNSSNLEYDGVVPIKFIKLYIGTNKIGGTLKNIYLGSIISSYLEIDFGDLGDARRNNIEFVLDTTFILDLLNLSSEEGYSTARTLMEIAERHKYQVKVLSETRRELDWLLERRIESLRNSNYDITLDQCSIYAAYARRGLNVTDLERIRSRYQTDLEEHYNVKYVEIVSNVVNRVKESSLYKGMMNRPNNPDGALHDAIAIDYVRRARKNHNVKRFSESRCWFVSSAGIDPSVWTPNSDWLPEQAKPDWLVSILWLSSPLVKGRDLAKVGISQLIASSVQKYIVPARVIAEFTRNIQRYAVGEISIDDYVLLSQQVAHASVINVDTANQLAEKGREYFIDYIREGIQRAAAAKMEDERVARKIIAEQEAKAEEYKRRYEDLINSYEEQLRNNSRDELLCRIEDYEDELRDAEVELGRLDSLYNAGICAREKVIRASLLGVLLVALVYFCFMAYQEPNAINIVASVLSSLPILLSATRKLAFKDLSSLSIDKIIYTCAKRSTSGTGYYEMARSQILVKINKLRSRLEKLKMIVP